MSDTTMRPGRLSVIYLAKWIVEGRGQGRYSGAAQDQERALARRLGSSNPLCTIIHRPWDPETVLIECGDDAFNVARHKEGEVFRYLGNDPQTQEHQGNGRSHL